ncbi:glyoxalase [Streptomyces spiroverticillatus]|uniref:Glyoxalase n=1 Tax=Streptomyces finlayi TaxID=67296 RepID=A0A918X781_9ACTN|nr:VOC family protein [Streptomyces finlayi]GHA40188.1 glyoxalase [Streptomyces spiroverticillatus]GHD15642.1 glyoxalase [Streptomyces finlayi]
MATYQQMIFLNLPVKDLEVSKNFFAKLGYGFNEQFSDERTASMPISETIVVMLLSEPRFKEFTTKEITDTSTHTEALIGISAESREKVDELCDAALAAGGSAANPPQDHGFMYGRSFQDPDGHIWEVIWMDPAAVQG